MGDWRMLRFAAGAVAGIVVVGCGDGDGAGEASFGTSTSGASTVTGTTTANTDGGTETAETDSGTTGTGSSGGGPVFDVGTQLDVDTGGGSPVCRVVEGGDGVPPCRESAPVDSFEPDIQWSFTPAGDEKNSAVIALVANLTDDDANGVVDLCDTPDVVLLAYPVGGSVNMAAGHIYVLDGATGALHYMIPEPLTWASTPAVADMDGDGAPEIIAQSKIDLQTNTGPLMIFDGQTGALEATGSASWSGHYGSAVAVANLDAQGPPEIYVDRAIADNTGQTLVAAPPSSSYPVSTAADIDDDGDMEIITPHGVYHHDGSLAWSVNLGNGFAQVANFDADDDPEILFTADNGLSMYEHDGTPIYVGLRPTGVPEMGNNWRRPATVHDFDGDELAEYATSSQFFYSLYEADATLVWSADVFDGGSAAGTAFDFLGDGGADAMYADETKLFVYDDLGGVLLETPRKSFTAIEYPVVADVDNDGSAEVVVISNDGNSGMIDQPTVQVIRDMQDRWVPTRRIWNQHAYHVSNVREDSVIPVVEPKSWLETNTFRTNFQMEGGGLCNPEPRG